ncbi:MAG: hypothetical protein F2659_02670, partial [Actinobacteria bacterium]|nr:hypothetical protein [Actinomycetota bacterium]
MAGPRRWLRTSRSAPTHAGGQWPSLGSRAAHRSVASRRRWWHRASVRCRGRCSAAASGVAASGAQAGWLNPVSARPVAYGDAPPRLAVLWCPDWSVVAAGASPIEPVAVLYANRVVARTPAAATAGVRQGHRRREAQRICPSLRLIDHDPARDGREFEAAVRSVAQMVPRLETTEPGSLTFLARGPSRYFG